MATRSFFAGAWVVLSVEEIQKDGVGTTTILPLFPAGVAFFLPFTVACGNFLVNLDQSVVVTALPGIGQSLGRAPSQLGLVMTVYILTLLVSMPLGGWLIDRFGSKACYISALIAFGGASIGCGAATTFSALILARGLQGFGGGLMGTVGQVAILRIFPRSKLLKVNIYIQVASQVGPLVGPLVGGALTTYVSWHWIFFVNVPLALASIALAAAYFPSKEHARAVKLDLVGFMLMSGGMTLLIFSMDSLGSGDRSTWLPLALLTFSVIALTATTLYLLQASKPILDLRLLKIRTVRISLLTGGSLDTIGMISITLLLPMMLQVGFGMSAVQSGSWTFMVGIGSLMPRAFLPPLLKRFGFRRILVANTPIVALLTGGFVLFQATTPMWVGLTYIFLFGFFRSIQWGTASNLSYADIGSNYLADFSVLYNGLWRVAASISMGTAMAMLSLLSPDGKTSSTNDFRIVMIVEALIILCALFAYRGLAANDGASISGHQLDLVIE